MWHLNCTFCLHRASGTVFTAIDVATGQEVRSVCFLIVGVPFLLTQFQDKGFLLLSNMGGGCGGRKPLILDLSTRWLLWLELEPKPQLWVGAGSIAAACHTPSVPLLSLSPHSLCCLACLPNPSAYPLAPIQPKTQSTCLLQAQPGLVTTVVVAAAPPGPQSKHMFPVLGWIRTQGLSRDGNRQRLQGGGRGGAWSGQQAAVVDPGVGRQRWWGLQMLVGDKGQGSAKCLGNRGQAFWTPPPPTRVSLLPSCCLPTATASPAWVVGATNLKWLSNNLVLYVENY